MTHMEQEAGSGGNYMKSVHITYNHRLVLIYGLLQDAHVIH
jgi:hypothetical protein